MKANLKELQPRVWTSISGYRWCCKTKEGSHDLTCTQVKYSSLDAKAVGVPQSSRIEPSVTITPPVTANLPTPKKAIVLVCPIAKCTNLFYNLDLIKLDCFGYCGVHGAQKTPPFIINAVYKLHGCLYKFTGDPRRYWINLILGE